MRQELNDIETIERYLLGQMPGNEKADFEMRMQASATLSAEVNLQAQCLQILETWGWKQQATTAFAQYRLQRRVKTWGIIVGMVLCAVFLFLITHAGKTPAPVPAPAQTTGSPGAMQQAVPPALPEPANTAATDSSMQVPDAFEVKTVVYRINPQHDTVLALNKRGTCLYIPQNAFVDEKGKPVKAPVQITFKEYTNAADMAFSNIPMSWIKNGQHHLFNSAGMFELNGSSKGRAVHIAREKPLRMDYRVTKKLPATGFYFLEGGKNWKMLDAEIEKCVEPIPVKSVLREVEDEFGHRNVVRDNIHRADSLMAVNNKMNNNRLNGSLLAEGADKGHTYPDVVKGLNVESFGVYNCDQVFRLSNLVNIRPVFVDGNGRPISDASVLSMIDLDYNGAFSFDPKAFYCNPKGKTVLLLLTESNRIYVLGSEQFASMQIQQAGSYTFKMTDRTATIKNSKDLARYLGLKQWNSL